MTFTKLILAALPVALAMPANATTLASIDATATQLIRASDPDCIAGAVIALNCIGGGGFITNHEEDRSFGFFLLDISTAADFAYNRAYLSLTEIRTGSFYSGTGTFSLVNSGFAASPALAAIDAGLASGTTAIGSLTGTGVGGNRLLLDMTDTLQFALSQGWSRIGITLTDTEADGKILGILGQNYNSGFTEQYYAQSEYEYPSLVLALNDVTAISEMTPARPTTLTGPPPPTEIPEPTALTLFGAGAFALGLGRRRYR